MIIDVLGGYSKHLETSVRKLLGARTRGVLERMQKSVILNFEHCQNIYDKYLVRELRTPHFHFFFSRNPETQVPQNLYFTDVITQIL